MSGARGVREHSRAVVSLVVHLKPERPSDIDALQQRRRASAQPVRDLQARSAIKFYLLEVRVDQDVVGIDMGAGHERARRLTERVYGGRVGADHVAQPASCSGQLPVLEKNVDGPAVRCADSHADGSRLVDGVHKPVNSSLWICGG